MLVSGPTSATIVARVGRSARRARRSRRDHREVVRGRSAASTDDARPGGNGKAGVAAHQLGRAGVDDLGALEPRDTAVAFADRRRFGIDSGDLQQRHENVRSPDSTVGAVRHRFDGQATEDAAEMVRQEPHHRAPGGVERAGRRIRDSHLDGCRCCGAHLLGRRHRLDPGDVGTACDEPFDLLAEGGNGTIVGKAAQRSEQLPRRSHRPGDDDRPFRRVGYLAGDRRCRLGQLEHSVLDAVQPEPVAIAAERIGEDDVGAGVDEALVEPGDDLRAVDVPELRRLARLQAQLEVVRPSRPVGKDNLASGQQVGQRAAHKRQPYVRSRGSV